MRAGAWEGFGSGDGVGLDIGSGPPGCVVDRDRDIDWLTDVVAVDAMVFVVVVSAMVPVVGVDTVVVACRVEDADEANSLNVVILQPRSNTASIRFAKSVVVTAPSKNSIGCIITTHTGLGERC